VNIRYALELVKDRQVTFAQWRYTPVLEQTLTNVLTSQDISFTKEAEGKYKLQAFQYHLKTPSEGLAQLKSIAAGYNSKASWELRKDSLLGCIVATLELDKLPKLSAAKPILTKTRTHNGYSVQDFALETLPGVFINGSIYMPLNAKGKLPVVFHPDGHFQRGRYREDCQYRAASLARMGVMSVSYDLFGWDGESLLQVNPAAHRKSLVNTLQIYNTQRLIDYVLSLPMVDTNRIGITGASGGGSQTMLTTAIATNEGIRKTIPFALAVPVGWLVIMLSCGLGIGALITEIPSLRLSIKLLGCAYLIWLSYKLCRTKQLQQLNVSFDF
jgi:hypothetical protein